MTIYEFLSYIPMGSDVELHLYAPENGISRNQTLRGTVLECSYSLESGHTKPQHLIRLLRPDGERRPVFLYEIEYVNLIHPPRDYGMNAEGTAVSAAVDKLFGTVNEFRDMAKIKSIPFSLKGEFTESLAELVQVLERRGLLTAAGQIRQLAQTGNLGGISAPAWEALFDSLTQARIDAQINGEADALLLRRSEALLCCFGHKKCMYDNPLRYSALLVRDNLVEEHSRVLPVTAFRDRLSLPGQALDWFILANVYFRCNMQDSCTYVAIVQSILHLGSFFENSINRRLFCYLCGGAHDFTVIGEMLGRVRTGEDGAEQRELFLEGQLQDFGKLMCWMLHQLGGQGCLDAAELLPLVTPKSALDNDQLRDLHERMLSFCFKYAPRNRNDRFMALSDAMRLLLERLENQPQYDEDEKLFGYIYEFHGPRGMVLSEVNGNILSDGLMPYWFSCSLEAYENLALVAQLQNIYDNAKEYHNYTLVAVRFRETLVETRKSRLGAYDMTIIPGGSISL